MLNSTTRILRTLALTGAAVAAITAQPALAADSAELGVSAEDSEVCNVSTLPVAFGIIDVTTAGNVDATGSFSVVCTSGTGNGTVADRRMTGAPSQLAYNLYKDASRLLVWGDGAGAVSSSGTSVDLTVYGRIPGAQNVQPDVYADSVTVTVAF